MKLYETYYGNNIQELNTTTIDDTVKIGSTDNNEYAEIKHKMHDPLRFPTLIPIQNNIWVVSYCLEQTTKKCYVVSNSLKEAVEKCVESGISDDRILSAHRVNELNETVVV